MNPQLKDIIALVIKDSTQLGFGLVSSRVANPIPKGKHIESYDEILSKNCLEGRESESKSGESLEVEKKNDSKKLSAAIEELESIRCSICKLLIDDDIKSLTEKKVFFDHIDEVYRLKEERFGEKRWDELTVEEQKDILNISNGATERKEGEKETWEKKSMKE